MKEPEAPQATAMLGEEGSAPQPDFGVSDEQTTEVEVVCAARNAASELRRVYLAFAFDVSGSMGGTGGDAELRYNTKWVPVVAATKAFFAEHESAGISAAMTFFPGPDAATRCTDAPYLVPNVPQTLLPSPAFATAIDGLDLRARTSATGGYVPSPNWRSSTPTLFAFNGTVASLQSVKDTPANATRAVVMVTDGVPEQCDGANDIQLVVDAVRNSGVLTFVVGVANPPQANGVVNNLDNLNLIAAAGGTEQAFIIATGDPAQTEADFKAVIDEIRGVAVSCNIEIPLPPSGTDFIPEQVNVTYGSGGAGDVPLAYDPDCVADDAWRYDNPDAPASIVLCTNTCGQVQQDVSARLVVEFGCERRGAPH